MVLLIVYVLIALCFSFICSLLEATLLTVTPAQVESAKAARRPWGKRMQLLKEDIDRPLSAILTLNTFAHTMGAAGAGAQYARVYGDIGEAIFAAALTLAILIFTEIIPKTLGARYALFFAPSVSSFLPWLIRFLAPLVWLCQRITRLIARSSGHGQNYDREELAAMAAASQKQGVIDEREGAVFKNMLRLQLIRISDLMTPRTVVFMRPEDETGSEFIKSIATFPYSRIPVYGESPEQITGFVMRSEVLYKQLTEGEDFQLRDLRRPLAITPEVARLDTVFERMVRERIHIMLVVDEFGSTTGLVTLEDVVETVFGFEIVDESDRYEDMQALARKRWEEKNSQ